MATSGFAELSKSELSLPPYALSWPHVGLPSIPKNVFGTKIFAIERAFFVENLAVKCPTVTIPPISFNVGT